MRNLSIFLVVLCSFLSLSLNAQKVKYKDIFELIQANNWEESDKLLKTYLSDPKNAEDANANYYMGKAYERWAMATNIISDTTQLLVYIDSANFYFGNALRLIDERELKKNDEYYQEFNRRDLRTGDFGIKVSDVHLDIENKIKALEERKKNVRSFHKESFKSGSLYEEAGEMMNELKKAFGSQQSLLLGFTKSQEQQLSEIEAKADALQKSLEAAQAALAAVPNAKFSVIVSAKPLQDAGSFNYSVLNLTAGGSASYFDLMAWTSQTRSELRNKVMPLRDELIAYDRELEAKKQSGNFEQIAMNEDIMASLKSYASNSLTEKVLTYKVEELSYLSEARPEAIPDSSRIDDLHKKVLALNDRLTRMNRLISISRPDAEKGFKENPVFFESRYVSPDQLLAYAEERKSFVEQEQSANLVASTYLESRKRWLLTTASDTISLALSDSVLNPGKNQTLLVADSAGLFATGLKGSEKGLFMFIAKASPAYTTEWLLEEKLLLPDKGFVFKPVNAGMVAFSEGFRSFYLFYPLKSKFKLFLATVSDSGTPLWKVSVDLDRAPHSFSFNKTVSETIVYLQAAPSSTSADLSYVVIDRAGKVRK